MFREDKPARKVTVLGEVELISWIKVEDLSKDHKGGILLKILEEGGQGPDGYKKPKDLSKCRVHYSVAAVVTIHSLIRTQAAACVGQTVSHYVELWSLPVQENGTVFAETPRVDYSSGYLAAYKGLQLEAIKSKSGPVQYVLDEGVELGESRS